MTEQDQMGAFVQEAFRKYGRFGHDFLVISPCFQHPHLKHLEYQTVSVGEVHKASWNRSQPTVLEIAVGLAATESSQFNPKIPILFGSVKIESRGVSPIFLCSLMRNLSFLELRSIDSKVILPFILPAPPIPRHPRQRPRLALGVTGNAVSLWNSSATFFMFSFAVGWNNVRNPIHHWLVVWNIWIIFILGMSSSQLTFIFFRGVGQPPTRSFKKNQDGPQNEQIQIGPNRSHD